jgi:hypothetical protein
MACAGFGRDGGGGISPKRPIASALPPLPIVGFPKPLNVYMDFDAKTVDAMIERLTVLRSQMLPPLPAPAKRN